MPSGLKLGKEAQAKFDEAKSNPDLAGTLDKKGAKRKNWNSRWFVLKDNYLFYCKNQKTNPQGIINLHGCTVSRIEGPTARPNSFSLLAPKSVSIDAKWTNRTYFAAARDPKEMEKWMRILEENGKKAVERAAAKKKDDPKKDTKTNAAGAAPSSPSTKKKAASSEEESESSSEDEKKPTKKGGSDSEKSESEEESEEEKGKKSESESEESEDDKKKKKESESESESD
jgi:hypothetical protein